MQLKLPALDALCTELQAEFERNPRGKGAAGILERYARSGQDWRDIAFFNVSCYTRNLVFRSELFELLLLCWGDGQVSPIHDHQGQNCWMGVLEGELEEVHFRAPEQGGAALVEGRISTFKPGGVAYIADEIALHQVRPVPGGSGVSLHLYAAPIDACHIFDRETGKDSRVELDYYSVRGSLCEESADAVRAAWCKGGQG